MEGGGRVGGGLRSWTIGKGGVEWNGIKEFFLQILA